VIGVEEERRKVPKTGLNVQVGLARSTAGGAFRPLRLA